MNRNDPVLVKFRTTEHFICIRTRTRHRSSPYSFDLSRERFAELEADGSLVVRDGHSFAVFSLTDDRTKIRIDVTWLSPCGGEAVKGFTQTVILDYAALSRNVAASLEEDGPTAWSMLYVDRAHSQPRLDFGGESARRTIRKVLSVPVLRHKLTRAVRDCFQWPNDGDIVIRFYGDCDPYSFFFREVVNGRRSICGGLILHRYDGLEKAHYEVHT